MQIVYEDNHLIAVVKPAGTSTEPHFEDEVKAFIKVRDQKPFNVYLKATHRLDRPASGIVLFAKTDKGLVRMHKLMRERKVKKTYYALVERVPALPIGSWEDHISKGEKKAFLDPYGKEAILHYETVSSKGNQALLKIDLVTGRYHQIRLQAASRGHFIVGDDLYKKGLASHEIALFHSKMEFIHPIKGTLCIIAVQCPFI